MNHKPLEIRTDLKPVLEYLLEHRGFDFSGYYPSMLERRVKQRLEALSCHDFTAYYSYLRDNKDEIDELLDAVTINVSRFFRDTLTFELVADQVLPCIIQDKTRTGDTSLRVWSAGCSRGEEPYSVAIIIHELLIREKQPVNQHIFATDIDQNVLKDAKNALYPASSIKNIKYRLLNKYFIPEKDYFRLIPEIRQKVSFSRYDMLDRKHGVPPESVFGDFDLVLCRNLLIYFSFEYQELIFKRLYRALADRGYLVLGMAETPPIAFRHHFRRVFEFSPIFQKS